MFYSPTAFVAKWNPLFQPNTTGEIEEVDLQAFAQDIADSFSGGGKSAYQVWLDAGHKGTVEDFLTYLRGKDAQSLYELWLAQGNTGSAAMFLLSLKGADGKTAYQLWLESGKSGTIVDFLNSLKGASAYDLWLATGKVGNQEAFLNSLRGFSGKSAYELWLEAGNSGSVTTFLNSLIGPKGENAVLFRILAVLEALPQSGTGGEGYIVDGHVWVWLTGSATWYDMGPTSVPGLSAYQVAVQNGYNGTETQWLASLVGKTAYQIAQANGYAGTEAQWLASLKGGEGISAYQVAVANGYAGTQAQWLVTLKGPEGRSAYQVAQANGFPGTEAQWLESLKGAGANYSSSNTIEFANSTANVKDGAITDAKLASDNKIGSLAALATTFTTAVRVSVVAALNFIIGIIGNPTELKTTAKTLVGAINELFDKPGGAGAGAADQTMLTLTVVNGVVNWNIAQGLDAQVTLTTNAALAILGAPENVIKDLRLRVKQGPNGGFTLAKPVNSTVIDGGTIVYSLPENSVDILTICWNGTSYEINYGPNYK